MNGISKLDHPHREMKSTSNRSRVSMKDKDKFKTVLKDTKEKPAATDEHPEAIPLAQLFTTQTPLEKDTLEKLPLDEVDEKKKKHPEKSLGAEDLASFQTLRFKDDLSKSYKTDAISKTETLLSEKVLDLFHEMVSHMTVMTAQNVQETTIHLSSPEFAASPFFGAQIIITEYSSAPRIFNIELIGNSEAALKFHAHIAELKHAFDTGPFSFEIHRIEATFAEEETSLFNRKERVSSDQEES
jgi:hypothetical protein